MLCISVDKQQLVSGQCLATRSRQPSSRWNFLMKSLTFSCGRCEEHRCSWRKAHTRPYLVLRRSHWRWRMMSRTTLALDKGDNHIMPIRWGPLQRDEREDNYWCLVYAGEPVHVKSLLNKLFMKKQLYSLRMKEGMPTLQHLNAFYKILSDLLALELKLEEEDKVFCCSLLFYQDMITWRLSSCMVRKH